MALLSTALPFAWPIAFALAFALPLLVLAYLRRQQRKRVPVSSILLYAELPKRPRARRKFKPPLQFFLELAALIALIIAIAEPFSRTTAERVAILLDTSLSIAAKDPNGTTQLLLLKKELETWLEKQANGTKYTLYTSAPGRMQRGERYSGAEDILSLVDDTLLTTTSDTLDADIEYLGKSEDYDRLLVVSERPLGDEISLASQSRVSYLSIQKRTPNFFLERFEFEDSSNTALLATLSYSAAESASVVLTIYGSTQLGGQEQQITKKQLTLDPDRPRRHRVVLNESQQRLALFRAVVEPAQSNQYLDAIAVDNQAWLATERSGSTQLLLVGYPDSGHGLDTLGPQGVTQVSPAEYLTLSQEEISRFDTIIFYALAPNSFPKRPTLFILPPENNALFPVLGVSDEAVISSWQVEHPLLRYLTVPLLQTRRSILFDIPPWGQALLRAEAGPIVIAGTKDGARRIAVGFELLPFEGRKTLTGSIFLLNALQWLGGGVELTSALRCGSSVRLTTDRAWVVRTPSGSLETFTADAQRDEQYTFVEAGVYIVSAAATDGSSAITRLYTVQGYNPRESYTWTPPALSIGELPQRNTRTEGRTPLWPWGVAIALGLLLMQMLIASLPRGATWNS